MRKRYYSPELTAYAFACGLDDLTSPAENFFDNKKKDIFGRL
ncbi:MAG: hypothetical protein SO434_05150 [Eubacteriales bacterium]|nr:hypothetical protein [Eubacteriales bacterium]